MLPIAGIAVWKKAAITVPNVRVINVKQKRKKIQATTKMFKRHDVTVMSNPICLRAVDNITAEDFFYYDKDGFELNLAEQKFYSAMGYPIQHPILNHTCWQEPWFYLEEGVDALILDHSMFLCRCNYAGDAYDQLEELKAAVPLADYLIKTKPKWGFDFALDAVRDGTTFEVLHVEYDHRDFEHFRNHMINFEWTVRHTDWHDAADRVWAQKDSWQHLKGFDQNHWKAEYLLGWRKAEYTEKTV